MHFRKMLSGIAFSVALLGTGVALTSVHPAQVQAASQFPIHGHARLPKYLRGGNLVVTAKKAYVYNSYGRRTKKCYKKGTVLLGITSVRIHGKKFYCLKKHKYVSSSEVKQRWVGNIDHNIHFRNHYHWSPIGRYH